MKNYFKILVIVLFVFTCLSQNALGQKSKDNYGLSTELLTKWKKDKNGCLGDRCYFVDSLLSNGLIIGITRNMLIELFGKPDKYGANRNSLVYFTCTKCSEKKNVLKNTDSSWLVFLLVDNRLKEIHAQIQ